MEINFALFMESDLAPEQDFVKGQPKWCEKGKLTFPDVPSTIMNQTGSGICDHIKDSGACFYVRNTKG